MKKLLATLAVVPLLGVSGIAMAQEPVHQPMQLSSGQMDTVTAGAAAGVVINLTALASGTGMAATNTTGLGTILQAPVVYMTPLGNVTLLGGAVVAFGSSTSGD